MVLFSFYLSQLVWWNIERSIEPPQLLPDRFHFEMSGFSGHEAQTQSNPQKQASRIANVHLFGSAPKVTKQVKKKKAPKSRLKLKLIGAFENGSEGRAIIEYKRRQYAYGVGDTIADLDAVLKEVYSTYIVIEREGREEVIELEKNQLESGFSPMKAGNEEEGASTEGASIAAEFTRFRTLALENPREAFTKVRFIPEKGKSGLRGYRIVSGSKDRMFVTRFGLRNGDIVTAVNGIDLISPDRGLDVMSELESASSITVDYLRAGRKQTIDIVLD